MGDVTAVVAGEVPPEQAEMRLYLLRLNIKSLVVSLVEEMLLEQPENPIAFFIERLRVKYPEESKLSAIDDHDASAVTARLQKKVDSQAETIVELKAKYKTLLKQKNELLDRLAQVEKGNDNDGGADADADADADAATTDEVTADNDGGAEMATDREDGGENGETTDKSVVNESVAEQGQQNEGEEEEKVEPSVLQESKSSAVSAEDTAISLPINVACEFTTTTPALTNENGDADYAGLRVHGVLTALRVGQDHSVYSYAFDADTVFPDGVPDIKWFVDKADTTKWLLNQLNGVLQLYGLNFVNDVLAGLEQEEKEPFEKGDTEGMAKVVAAKVAEQKAGVEKREVESKIKIAVMPRAANEWERLEMLTVVKNDFVPRLVEVRMYVKEGDEGGGDAGTSEPTVYSRNYTMGDDESPPNTKSIDHSWEGPRWAMASLVVDAVTMGLTVPHVCSYLRSLPPDTSKEPDEKVTCRLVPPTQSDGDATLTKKFHLHAEDKQFKYTVAATPDANGTIVGCIVDGESPPDEGENDPRSGHLLFDNVREYLPDNLSTLPTLNWMLPDGVNSSNIREIVEEVLDQMQSDDEEEGEEEEGGA